MQAVERDCSAFHKAVDARLGNAEYTGQLLDRDEVRLAVELSSEVGHIIQLLTDNCRGAAGGTLSRLVARGGNRHITAIGLLSLSFRRRQ